MGESMGGWVSRWGVGVSMGGGCVDGGWVSGWGWGWGGESMGGG